MPQINRLDQNQLDMYKVPAGAKDACWVRSTGLIEATYQGRRQIYCPWEAAWYESYGAYYEAMVAREDG